MKRNRVAILTQPLSCNYGGILQNYALQKVLKNLGHLPTTIDHDYLWYLKIKDFLWRRKMDALHAILPSRYSKPTYIPNRREVASYCKNTDRFIEKYILRTKPFRSRKKFSLLSRHNEYDAYIVGSDQVWRPTYNKPFQGEMFLDFVDGADSAKRISYAASFGVDSWEFTDEQTELYSTLLGRFNSVSVREESGISLCQKHFGVDAIQVLDPTMLLEKDEYCMLVRGENEPKSKGNLFSYILDPSKEKTAFIKNAAETLGLTAFQILPEHPVGNRSKAHIKYDMENCVYPSVTSWLRAFLDAEMVIVDSFHGVVFSIIFNKPFWVIGNSERGMSRFVSLLDMFGLQSRLLDAHSLGDNDVNAPIDWRVVNEILAKKKQDSISFLRESLA